MRSALAKTAGVINAEVSMPDKAEVSYDKSKTTVEEMIAAVKQAGYGAGVRR